MFGVKLVGRRRVGDRRSFIATSRDKGVNSNDLFSETLLLISSFPHPQLLSDLAMLAALP